MHKKILSYLQKDQANNNSADLVYRLQAEAFFHLHILHNRYGLIVIYAAVCTDFAHACNCDMTCLLTPQEYFFWQSVNMRLMPDEKALGTYLLQSKLFMISYFMGLKVPALIWTDGSVDNVYVFTSLSLYFWMDRATERQSSKICSA